MSKLKNILMLSCKKSSELIEKKLFADLSFIEKIQLSMHTGMCDACKKWEEQNKELDNTLNQHICGESENRNEKLSDKTKEAIIQEIEKKS